MSQIVAASPHVTTKNSTAVIMRDVLIALCPALIAGCVVFGLRALLVVAVTTALASSSSGVMKSSAASPAPSVIFPQQSPACCWR
mgnify:CR=1 FL=1